MAFRIGTTRDLLTASGKPAFNAAAFEELQGNPDIEWEWIPEDVSEITPDIAARYDGLHVNLPRVTATSVARDDCRVKIIARNGVGFDTVSRPVPPRGSPSPIRRSRSAGQLPWPRSR